MFSRKVGQLSGCSIAAGSLDQARARENAPPALGENTGGASCEAAGMGEALPRNLLNWDLGHVNDQVGRRTHNRACGQNIDKNF